MDLLRLCFFSGKGYIESNLWDLGRHVGKYGDLGCVCVCVNVWDLEDIQGKSTQWIYNYEGEWILIP